jgi:hypothetical protein
MDKRKPFDGDFVVQRGNPGSFVNNNIDGLLAYKEMRNRKLSETSNKSDEINNIRDEVNIIKNDILQIKDLLIKVLESK